MMHDHPVDSVSGDLFRRSEFALRLASLIKNRVDKESVVIGINGKWGEGKTTVLNFIAEDLKSSYPNTIVIKFNPWRFSEESKLLDIFFTTISKDLSNSLNSEEKKAGMSSHERKEDIKRMADILGEYGDAISEIPFPVTNWLGKIVKATAKKVSATELEEKKKNLSDLISKYKRKIVVIIDDIDRLSKDEVYSIFRLVKLSGDFNHFVYLLAYDEEMVSAAIGHRFGDGDKAAGRSFLEKIVQIPVKLPEITFQDLNRFFAVSFEKILNDNKIVIDQQTKRRFDAVFASTLVFNLDSPRKVIRYCNALQVAIPLMQGETNFTDLVLFEGIKIFFPKQYEFIRDNSHYFIYSGANEWSQEIKTNFENEFNKLSATLSNRDKKSIKDLLTELFPTLNAVWKNMTYPPDAYHRWMIEKRIVTREYFTRYVTFALGETDISDRAFDRLLASIRKSEEPNDIAAQLNLFSQQYEIGGVVRKLRQIENKFTEVESKNVAKGISQIAKLLPHYVGFMEYSLSPFSQAAIFVAKLVINIKSQHERYELADDLLFRASTFEFAHEVNRWLRELNKKDSVFTDDEFLMMGGKLKDRCIQESSPDLFFVKYPDTADYIVLVWSKLDRNNIVEYLKTVCTEPVVVVKFLEAMVGKSYSSSFTSSDGESDTTHEFISDFTEKTHAFLADTVGTDWLYDTLKRGYGIDYGQDAILDTKFSISQTHDNLVKQFMFLHRKLT